MTTEDKLRDLIKERYDSITNFAKYCKIPSPTISSILDRGIDRATLTNVIAICDTLHISADDLAKGEIVHVIKENNDKQIDVVDILAVAKQQLLNNKALMFNGKPADEESIQSILSAMEVGMEIARRKNK